MISLTDEQKAAVDHPTDVMLAACPGSGKTRAILAKLLTLADEVVGTPHFIGCITYTNAAVDEIEHRLRKYGSSASNEKCEVATIHSFCLQFILRPYHWLIPEIPKNFRVITPEANDFERIVRAAEDGIGRRPGQRTLDDYSSLRLDLEGNPCGDGFATGSITDASARLYWQFLKADGYLDFSMIIYYTWRILSDHQFVGRGLASRFKWLLVDEFQDTSDLQIAIFQELQKHLLTHYFMVGDDNQSILSFAGARPDLARKFLEDINAELGLSLRQNFRSAPEIVAVAETLIPTVPAMRSAGEAAHLNAEVRYVHAHLPVDAITDHFLPLLAAEGIELGKAAILAPWWTHLIPIARRLREFEVPVFGPGARPYRRRRIFAVIAEQLGACAEAEHYLGLPGVERALFRLINDLTGETRFDVFSYIGRRTALALIYSAKRLARTQPSGVEWLGATAVEVADILVGEGWLPESARTVLPSSVEDMINDMRLNNVDLANFLVSDLGLFANPDRALKLITLHNSKGREFDAVAMVCMNQGHIPHFTARTEEAIDEARRLFYVGLTRAKRVLLVASDQSDRRNRPTPFIEEAGLHL